MTDPKPKLRWYQFSLRTLMVVVTLFAIPCGWVGWKMQQARQERKAAEAIKKMGGVVYWSEPSGPAWLRRLLGDGHFRHMVYVALVHTQVADGGLENLKQFSQLQWLVLQDSQITDAGLENLKGLNKLRRLYLDHTKVTDGGLENLKGLNQLQVLGLSDTKVSDEGVKKLRQALPNCGIVL